MSSSFFDKNNVAQAWSAIDNAQKVTLLTHYKPDGDGISACAALSSLLEEKGKLCETIYPTAADFNFSHVPSKVLINTHSMIPDLIIACDTANYDRLYYPEAFHAIPLMNIDHHLANELKGAFNFVDPQASSTCEVLHTLMMTWDKNLINPWRADALLCGLLYDTQIFHTNATTDKTLQSAAELVSLGASLTELKDELLKTKSLHIIQFWGTILSNVKITRSGQAAWVCITQKTLKEHDVTLSSLIGFVNFLASISSVDTTVLFYETEDGKTKISLRSRFRDVNALAQPFGGGGHKNAAGIVSSQPLDKLVQEITAQL